MKRAMAAFLAVAFPLAVGPALGQSLTFTPKDTGGSTGSKSPITVTADGGMEWQKDNQVFIAHGNAKAAQDDMTVTADTLIAHYRKKAAKPAGQDVAVDKVSSSDDTGDNEIYRIDAQSHVTMASKAETATGDAAVYDLDKGLLVVSGKIVTLTSHDGVVTSHHDVQYWSNEDVAVANGDAQAIDTNPNVKRSFTADRIVAYFRDADGSSATAPNAKPKNSDPKSKTPDLHKQRDISYLQGFGNVVLITNGDVVRGERANYNVDSGIATVEGNVKATRDNTQAAGGFAVVNVKGGVSRLYGSAAQAKMQSPQESARVKALLLPKESDSQTPGAGKGG
jgi:lipopolysaccharide export system protein LptA